MIGKTWRKTFDNDTYLDISVYPNKWTTGINMSLWENGNGVALKTSDKVYFNFETILPLKLSEKIGTYLINKQSREVTGFNLTEKWEEL